MRHLIIGNDAARNYTSNILDDKAVDIQKLGVDGPQSLGAGEGVADSEQIRFVQGTGAKAIVSPWIYGRNIVAASGKSNAAAAPHKHTLTFANTSGTAGVLDLKFVRRDGPAPEFFRLSVDIPASTAHTAADALVKTAYEAATLPDWLEDVCDATAGATVVFEGAIRGDVAQSGNSWEYGPVVFDLIVEQYTGTTLTATASSASSPTQSADPGVGDGNLIAQLEKDLRGGTYGFYDRRNLPKTPAATAVAATTYDVYNVVASKDGSTSSGINGVDNLIEIMIVLDNSGTGQQAFESQLNGYIGSVNFAPISL